MTQLPDVELLKTSSGYCKHCPSTIVRCCSCRKHFIKFNHPHCDHCFWDKYGCSCSVCKKTNKKELLLLSHNANKIKL